MDATRVAEAIEFPVALAPEPQTCVGLIALANDGTIERDVADFLPDEDLRLCTTRIHTPRRNNLDTLNAMQERLAAAMTTLVPEDRLDVVLFGCTSGTVVLGPETVKATIASVRPNLPVTDPISAATGALDRLGCHRIGLLTPYIREVHAVVARYLCEHGFDVRAQGFFPLVDDNGRSRVKPESFLSAAERLMADAGIQALFVSCTALRTTGLVELLEHRIGRPVVTSNQALCWDALRRTGDRRSIRQGGCLSKLSEQKSA